MLHEQEIRTILLRDWDPFCVGDNPNLADEYDPFISEILFRLQAHCSAEELQKYFVQLEEKLEAQTPDEERLKTVTALKKLQISPPSS